MSSRSIHRWLILAALLLWVGTAQAGRKRVVVLDFDGPKSEKFHEDVVKLVGKKHTIVSTEKWNAKAEELDAAKVTEKNVKKIAKKLKVDGVITGKIDKRRDEYIIKLKLRSGATGEILGNSVQTKAEGPRIEGQTARDIKDELISQIEELESNRGGGGDDEGEDEGKKKKGDDEEGEDGGRKKSGFSRKDDDEDRSKKKDDEEKARKDEEKARKEEEKARRDEEKKRKSEEALSTKGEDEERKSDDDEDRPKKKKKKKRKADRDDEDGSEDSVEEEGGGDEDDSDAALNLIPANRAVDAVVGLSFTRRNLTFQFASDLGKQPPGYRQPIPVAGALVDVTIYPMAFTRKKKDITTGIGLNILYDQVLIINSRKRYLDMMGTALTADLTTKENRWSVGGVFRYPVTTGPKAIVVGGMLSYGKQKFEIAQQLPNMEPTDIPNVEYTMITPSAFVRFPITEKIIANLDAGFHAITNTGAIQTRSQYGAATVAGYELDLGGDYMVTKNIFARASIRYQSIGFTFKGDPMSQTHTRDTDPEQDVTGAKDVYFGGSVTAGYVF